MRELDALQDAIQKAGGQEKLAKLLGLRSQGSISNWLHRNKRVPTEHVLGIEAATGVSRHDLRPDIYPRESRRSKPATALSA